MNFPYAILASQDLFNASWTEGNLYKIQGVTDALGTFACWIISVVGFGMVIFAIAKNALSGLYVVNPKLWDKVDDLKKASISGVESLKNVNIGGQKGNAAFQKIGGALAFFINLLPNVKELTDFEDGDEIDKKQYFMKSLPMCIIYIFIGMFIFFGYPSKVANWVGTAGTACVDMVLNNVDPEATIASVSGKFINVKFSTDGAKDAYSKNINESAKAAYTALTGTLTDMTKDSRQESAYNIETYILNATTGLGDTIGAEEGFDFGVTASYYTTMPTFVNENSGWTNIGNGVYMSANSSGDISYKIAIPISGIPHGSTMSTGSDYIEVTMSVTAVATSGTNLSGVNIYASFKENIPTKVFHDTGDNKKMYLDLSNAGKYVTYVNKGDPSNGQSSLTGGAGNPVTVTFYGTKKGSTSDIITQSGGATLELRSGNITVLMDKQNVLKLDQVFDKITCVVLSDSSMKITSVSSAFSATAPVNTIQFGDVDGAPLHNFVSSGYGYYSIYGDYIGSDSGNLNDYMKSGKVAE